MRTDLVATSLVNPRTYWDTVSGRNYLRHQAAAIERVMKRKGAAVGGCSSIVQRIFIHDEDRLDELVPILRMHEEYEIWVSVALYHEVPPDLRQDFSVLDRKLYVYLELDAQREPVTAGFAVRGGSVDYEVDEALRRFEALKRYCRLPREIPELAALLDRPTVE